MFIQSENLKNYIINNLDIKDENNIQQDELNNLKELNLNRLNLSLKEASFYPQELAYLKKLEILSFSMFLINDEIKENLEKLELLKILDFDFCRNMSKRKLNIKIEKMYLNHSDFSFVNILENKMSVKTLYLQNVEEVDINEICEYENIEELQLLNCKVINSMSLNKLLNLKNVKIIGSTLDNLSIIEILKPKINVTFSTKKFYNVG